MLDILHLDYLAVYRSVLAVVVMGLKERVHQAAIVEIRTETLKQRANRPLDSFAVIAWFSILTSPSSVESLVRNPRASRKSTTVRVRCLGQQWRLGVSDRRIP